MSQVRKKPVTSFFWRLAERCGAQGVTFIVSIILARLLEPEVYGTIALITVFTTILNVFVDSGMGNALIQKKNADDLDFSSVFFFNIIMCSVLYVLIFFAAPVIAEFYQNDEMISLIRVLSITLLISGVKNVQCAYVSKKLMFKSFFVATIGGTIGSAIVGIAMAVYGFGVWALVAQYLFNTAVDTFILWLTVKWYPKKMFSFARLKGLISYGWKLLVSSLLDTLYNNLRTLIIGKMYSTSDLSFYNKGSQFPTLLTANISVSIDSVLFPLMSEAQDNTISVKMMTRRAIKISTYAIAPLMIGMAFCGNSLIRLLLTDKWLPCVPYLRIFCIIYMFYPVHTANLNAIKALGRSDLFLKLEIVKKVVGLILLIFTMWFGAIAMAYSLLVSTVISMIVNSWPNRKLLCYDFREQIRDILPSILLAVLMGICVWPIELLGLQPSITLIVQVTLGAIIYIGISRLFRLDSFQYLWGTLKQIVGKKSK